MIMSTRHANISHDGTTKHGAEQLKKMKKKHGDVNVGRPTEWENCVEGELVFC